MRTVHAMCYGVQYAAGNSGAVAKTGQNVQFVVGFDDPRSYLPKSVQDILISNVLPVVFFIDGCKVVSVIEKPPR